jgi:hypothetical protein
MVRELVTFAARANNFLPSLDGVSTTLSPETIVTGRGKPDFRTMTLEFGTYVQVYDGTSNDTKSRTLGAIALNPTGNSSGDFYFMSLTTGQRIHRRSWTVLPISDLVISRVDAIGKEENMPPVDHNNMISEYNPDETVDESAYDRDYNPPDKPDNASDHELTTDAYTSEDSSDEESHDDDEDDDDDDGDDQGHLPEFDDAPLAPPHNAATPIVQNEERAPAPAAPANEERATPKESAPAPAAPENEERATPANEERTATPPPQHRVRFVSSNDPDQPPLKPAAPLPTETTAATNAVPPQSNRGRSLRTKRVPDYSYRFGFTQNASTQLPQGMTWDDVHTAIHTMPAPPTAPENTPGHDMHAVQKAIYGLIFTQMSARAGLKKHGQVAWDALKKEFEQFKQLEVLEPLDAHKMSDEHKKEALRALSVIKRNATAASKDVPLPTAVSNATSIKTKQLDHLPSTMTLFFSPS